jgi:hypothetical protein
MTARRWITIAIAASIAIVAACASPNPAGFDDQEMAPLPEAPTDTTGFVSPSREI